MPNTPNFGPNASKVSAIADAIRELELAEKPKKPEKRATDKGSLKTNHSLNWSRYALTILLVSVKLGVFATDPNLLADTSWWIVLLPAYIVELGYLAALLLIAVLVAISLLIFYGFLGVKNLVNIYKTRKSIQRSLDELHSAKETL